MINKAAGKLVYRNFNSFSKNVKSQVRLKRARTESDISRPQGSNPWTDDEHIIMRDDFYDSETITDIRSKFDKIVQNDSQIETITHAGDIYQKYIGNYTNEPFDFEQHFPEVERLITDEVRQLLELYYQSHFEVDYVKLYRNYHIPPEIHEQTGIYSDRWHTDSYQPDATKLFVNLSDVTEDHGPFHIISRENTKRLVDMQFDRNEDGIPGRKVEPQADVIKATGKAGTAMIANSNLCLHRADNPSQGNRRDLAMLVFNPSDDPCPDDWVKHLSAGRNLSSS